MKMKRGVFQGYNDWDVCMDNINTTWRRVLRPRLFKYFLVVSVVTFCIYKLLFAAPTKIVLPSNVDTTKFPPFEPEVATDLPSGDGSGSKIPKIIHQTWETATIPSKFVNNIKSFTKNNPSWKYYLWTDDAIQALIDNHFPELLPVWNSYVYSYHHRLRRFNAARYLILYKYGGVFADMDTVNYRPLDTAVQKYSCILPTEPFEHSYSTYMSFTLTNSILLCRAKHPFFKLLVDNLKHFVHLSHSWDSAGPGYLTSQYRLYINMRKSTKASTEQKQQFPLDSRPYVVQDHLSLDNPDELYVPNSQYFTGNSDISLHSTLSKSCSAFNEIRRPLQRVCVDLSRRGLVRERSKFTYTEHLWQNNWYGWSNFYVYTRIYLFFFGTNIHDLVPDCKIYPF